MKNLFKVLIIPFAIYSCGPSKQNTPVVKDSLPNVIESAPQEKSVEDYAQTITEEELKEMLYIYASDEFEGRETGEPGQKKAINYLMEFYKSQNITSPLGDDDYFQEVPLEKLLMPKITMTIQGKEYSDLEDMFPVKGAKSELITTDQIIYLGYGIDDIKYNDYKNIDVKNKVVLIKWGEPRNDDGTYVTSGTKEETKWSNGRQARSSKANAALKKGAAAVLYMAESDLHKGGLESYKRLKDQEGSGNISLLDQENNNLYLSISEKVAKALYPQILKNDSPKLIDRLLSIDYFSEANEVSSENVVAYIKGSDKPEEVLVISAHLDHEGIKDGEIYNGADDDGSGTIAMLEIAEAFQQAVKDGKGPKRSILFLHVTGEEKGLLGSKYYTDIDPIFPLANTIADLNVDMIGRSDPKRSGERNYIYLIGSDKLSSELHEISEEVNSKFTNLELDYTYNDENDPNRFYYRSDHYNFAKNNIPIIFYFNGTHADYHRPSDTPDKIEYDLMENRTRLIFHTAWEIANRANRIVADKAMSN